ncbi:uncharacterized protein LOC117173483 [Belonocnema kinseyi]|uniref:uncharacterized protein LOC117173483 n=1 Tax=Belonocnema kinseyi TaxID=2817044 RepID=UPI00143CEAAB|nr:uncharacterized protein LOC117173483 [Belonocnema kinseyi]XP_033217978.1 uncharacterized protein LOC117173483 [Belonocnema kinseyi]
MKAIYTLVFTLVVIFKSIESSSEPLSGSEERRLRLERLMFQEFGYAPASYLLPHHQQRTSRQETTSSQQEPVKFTEGDVIYRGHDPVAKVTGEAIYDHPVKNGELKLAELKPGDKLHHNGGVIAEYDGKIWHTFIQQG